MGDEKDAGRSEDDPSTLDRVYAAKPERGALELALASMAVADRSATKAQYHVVENAKVSEWVTDDGVAIRIVRGPRYDGTRKLVDVEVEALDANGELLPVDNPYQFVNPPLKVPDGTWRKETRDDGEVVEIQNTREDVQAAFQIMVTETVISQALAMGWKPPQ